MPNKTYLFAATLVATAITMLSPSESQAQVYYNSVQCPVGSIRSYNPVYRAYTCYYPSAFGVANYRPNLSAGVYLGPGYAPYRYPTFSTSRYPTYRYPANQNRNTYQNRYQQSYGNRGSRR